MIPIDNDKFSQAHSAFLRYMKKMGNGVPFTDFGHRFLLTDEISYKIEALRKGRTLLSFEKWPTWQKKPGRIVEALREACKQPVSANLLVHKFGDNNSYCALYRLESKDLVRSFEEQIVKLYSVVNESDTTLSAAFDCFAGFLKKHRLGCKWDFVAYLMFLMRPERFFPIKPSRFEPLLHFYGVECQISNKVSWEGYRLILDVGEAVKEKLSIYGPRSAIDVQSYMWIVSQLLPTVHEGDGYWTADYDVDFDEELRKRQQGEIERQRIGVLGEKHVFEAEKASLAAAGREDLVQRVSLVSANDQKAGYDVLSYTREGEEKHIEVKSTAHSKGEFDRFWLSDNEVERGSTDPSWTVYRVWCADGDAYHQDLGNIIRTGSKEWRREVSSWVVQKVPAREEKQRCLR